MANVNAPSGFSPVGHLLGLDWNGKGRVYYIPSSDTNALAIGDPVKISGTADSNGVPAVTLATAGATMRGVILAIGTKAGKASYIDPSNLALTVAPATKVVDYYALVADDPYIVFKAQEANSGTPWAAADVGLNANFVAGTNNGYVSGFVLDNSTEATTSTLNVKLLGLAQEQNNAYGVAAKWLVQLNNHDFKVGVAGI